MISKFTLIKYALKHGWDTCEDDIDEVEIDTSMIRLICSEGYSFKNYDSEDIDNFLDLISYNDIDDVLKFIIDDKKMDKHVLVGYWSEYRGGDEVRDLYKILENESMLYQPDIDLLSNDDINLYLTHLDDNDDEFKDMLLKAQSFMTYCFYKFKENREIDDDDIKQFYNEGGLEDARFTLEVAISNGFTNSLNNYPETDNGMLYRKTYDDKLMIVGEIFDMFDYDEKVTSEYFEHQYGVYEESFDDQIEMAGHRQHMKEAEKDDRRNNRISYSDAQEYIKDNIFTVHISISEGGISMSGEDMRFDALYVNYKLIGETSEVNIGNNKKPWISGRDFGDHSLSKDFFFDNVNKYKIENKEQPRGKSCAGGNHCSIYGFMEQDVKNKE